MDTREQDVIAPAYWFRPKQFWKKFAFYYPSSIEGWLAVLLILGMIAHMYIRVDNLSHSAVETFMGFLPWAISAMAILDILCIRKGEYPTWWEKK